MSHNFKVGQRVVISETDITGTITHIFKFNGFIEILFDDNKLMIMSPVQIKAAV